MSIVSESGSPERFSLLRGVLMFVGAGVVAAGCWFGYGSFKNRATEPTTAPNCYGAAEAYVPQNQTMPLIGALTTVYFKSTADRFASAFAAPNADSASRNAATYS